MKLLRSLFLFGSSTFDVPVEWKHVPNPPLPTSTFWKFAHSLPLPLFLILLNFHIFVRVIATVFTAPIRPSWTFSTKVLHAILQSAMEGMAPQGRHSTDICRLISRFSVPSVLARAEVVAVKGELGEAVKGERLKLWHRVCDVVGVDPSTVEYDATVDRLKGEWVKNWDVGSVVKERASVTLFIHGGAHIFMSPGTHRGLTSHISKETNGPVFALDYSLAPEAIFPVAIFETLLVYSSLIGTPEFNGFPTSYHTIFANPLSKASFRPEQIQIMGDSSGGCLVTQTLLVMKALGIQMPNCAVLMSPFVDATCNSPSFTLNWTSDFLTLDPTGMQWALSAYSGKNTSKAHPILSPVFHKDFSGLCRILIQVGDAEVLLNDSIMLFEGMKASGCDVELQVFTDMFHVFQVFPSVKAASVAVKKVAEFCVKTPNEE